MAILLHSAFPDINIEKDCSRYYWLGALEEVMPERFILLDANVTAAANYLPRCATSTKTQSRSALLFDSVRSGVSPFFLYLPNFCVAEVFSVFMKHAFGSWNRHVKAGTVDRRVYNSLVKQFASDIHNGRLIYHYELSRTTFCQSISLHRSTTISRSHECERARRPREARRTGHR